MERQVVHVTEADVVRDIAAILQRVEAGAEVIVERNDQPVAIIRPALPARRTISENIALAKAHEFESAEVPTLDADFASDVEDIVSSRKPWNPPAWD